MYIFIPIRKMFTMFVECSYAYRNPKNLKLVQVWNFLFTFLSLRFFDMRERHNFFLCWLFHLTPPRAAPHCKLLVCPRQAPENQLPSSSVESQQTFFFSNPKILSPSLPSMMSFTSPVLFSIWGFYCDICDCYIRPTCVWIPALNVCT